MLSSSVQATLVGRYANGEYGRSKRAGEDLVFSYSKETGAKVLVYRFPNVFGKWCRPNYNSAVATFCNNIACDLPITVNDPDTEIELLYIDDLVEELLGAIEGKEHRCEFDGKDTVVCENGRFCAVPTTYRTTVGQVVDTLKKFSLHPKTLVMPEIPDGSLEKNFILPIFHIFRKKRYLFRCRCTLISGDRLPN